MPKKKQIEIEITENMPPGFVDDSAMWESGKIGASAKYAAAAPQELETAINESLGLHCTFADMVI